jgi:tetratricopeptide (TPR) repeat protein
MKKILFMAILSLSLMVCVTSPGWAGGLDDINAGLAAASGGNYDEAIRLFTKGIASGELSGENLSKVYNNRGDAWVKKGDSDKAIADYTKAIEIMPKDAAAYGNRGIAWDDKGAYDQAVADYTKAAEIDTEKHQIAIAIAGQSFVRVKLRIYVEKIVGKYAKAFVTGESGHGENEVAYLEKRGKVWIVLNQGTAVDPRDLNIPEEAW